MHFRITILAKCQLLYRDSIAATIRHVCNSLEEQGEPKSFGYQVISAFNEAYNNLVSHGGEGVAGKNVLVSIIVNDHQLVIDMEDDSGGFTPPPRTPITKDLRESGMGLSIMREFMDSVEYKKKIKNGTNTLRMVRNLTIENGVIILSLRGKLDALTAAKIKPVLDEILSNPGAEIVYDFDGLTLIDSSGIGVIVSTFKRSRADGGDTKIACIHDQPLEVFQVLNLHKYIEVFDAVETAAASFPKKRK